MVVAEKLRECREKLGLSQSKLAQSVGVSRAYIAQIENRSKEPSADVIQRIAAALHVEVRELLEDGEYGYINGKVVRVEQVNVLDSKSNHEATRESTTDADCLTEIPVTVLFGAVWGLMQDARLRSLHGTPPLSGLRLSISPPMDDPIALERVECRVSDDGARIELILPEVSDVRLDWLARTCPYPPSVSHNSTLVWFTPFASLSDQLHYLRQLQSDQIEPTLMNPVLSAEWDLMKSLI